MNSIPKSVSSAPGRAVVLAFLAAGLLWGATTYAAVECEAYLDSFELSGPGVMIGGIDHFDDGGEGDWTCGDFGDWEDEPGTTYARLWNSVDTSGLAEGAHYFMTKIFTYPTRTFDTAAGMGDFVGTATFKNELPAPDQDLVLDCISNYVIGDEPYQDSVYIGLYHLSAQTASRYGPSWSAGYYISQARLTFVAEPTEPPFVSDLAVTPITLPDNQDTIVFSIEYTDDSVEPYFTLRYKLSEAEGFVTPFGPISSNLGEYALPDSFGFWGISTAMTYFVSGIGSMPIDIKPGGYPNAINPNSRGVIPVAILSTDTFDATTVDVTTLAFGPDGAAPAHRNGHYEYVNDDGLMDLLTHYRTQETGIACGDVEAGLVGQTLSGQPLEGTDSIRVVGCGSGSSLSRPSALRSIPLRPTRQGKVRPRPVDENGGLTSGD